VDLSDQLAQRISLPPRREETPHATIKTSDDDPNILVLVGLRDAVESALRAIVSRVPYVSYEYNKYGPYTTIVARVRGIENGRCVAEYGELVLLVQNSPKCLEGSSQVVHIVKPATHSDKKAIAYPGIAILKDTLVLLDDGMGKVIFSEHIRDPERRATLLTLSSSLTRQGFSIRWRSAAKASPLEKIARDLEEALNELNTVKSRQYKVGDVVTEGEAIAFVILTRPSKEYLDDIRNSVVPTARGHHIMRTCGRLTEFADIVDFMTRYIDRNELYKALLYAIAESSLGKRFYIKHRKPPSKVIDLGPMETVDIVDSSRLGKVLVGRRAIKSGGVYDGLGIPKERGDIVLSFIPIDAWFIVHRYIGVDGEEKGIYININTPPEICLESRTISYLDLFVDVVYSENEIKIIDEEELDKAVENKLLGQDFVKAVRETIDYIKNNIDYIIPLVRSLHQ